MEYMHGGDIYTYENVTDYSVNLNPFGPGEEVLLAMEESLKHAGEYPDSKSRKLRSALAEHLQVPQEFLIFGNGAAELIFLVIHSLRPKKALLTIPSFAEYHRALQAVDCECVYYPLSEKHGFVPQTSYLELLKEDVDLLFLCSPDNPSGAVIPKDFLLEILKTCEEKGILMILDECFVEFLSGVAQAAGCAALKETKRWQEMRKWLETERAWLEENLTRIGVEWFPSKVNYLLLKSPYPLFSLLLQKNILIRDCSNYEGLEKGYYRIAVKQRTDNEKLLKALEYIYEGGE